MPTVPRSFADLHDLHPDPISPPTLTCDKSFPARSLCPGWSPTWMPSAASTLGSRARHSPGPAARCRPPTPRCPALWFSLHHLLHQGMFSICLLVQPRGTVQTPAPVPSGTGVRAEEQQGQAAEQWWGPCTAQHCAGLHPDATSSRRPSLTAWP